MSGRLACPACGEAEELTGTPLCVACDRGQQPGPGSILPR